MSLTIVRFWIQCFYELLFPLSHHFGGINAIDIALVPNAKIGLKYLIVYAEHLLSLNQPLDSRTLSIVYEAAKLYTLMKTDDKDKAWSELRNSARLVQFSNAPMYLQVGASKGSWSLMHDAVYAMGSLYGAPLHGGTFLRSVMFACYD